MAKTADKSDELNEQFVTITWNLMERVDNQMNREGMRKLTNEYEWTGEALGYCLTIFLNGNDLEKALSVVKKLSAEQNKIVGYPRSQTLKLFCEKSLNGSQFTYAFQCVKYCNSIGKTEVCKAVLAHAQSLNLTQSVMQTFETLCSSSLLKEEVDETQ